MKFYSSQHVLLFLYIIDLFVASCFISLVIAGNIWPKGKSLSINDNGTFPSILFNHITHREQNKNIILSPFSIQSALTLLYMGAEGETANEFQKVLHLNSSNKTETASNFLNIIKSMSTNNSAQIKSANRIYTRFNLVPKFNDIALNYFQAEAEMVDFKLKEQTANKINTWVEDNTNKKIQNLISPDSIDDYTIAMLVNAIYFKAQWSDQFSKRATQTKPFYISANETRDVDMMSGEITCKYGTLPELDATAIELKYENSNMVMDVILPNEIDGLKDLERRFSISDLDKAFKDIYEEEVNVKLPRFRIEFDTDLVSVLEEMGMKTSFNYGANFKSIFNTDVPVKISDVIHKAFIDVNEFGSEAAAATYIKISYLSAFSHATGTFNADHPFMFVIRSPETVYFMGQVTQF